jgi:hypothetical protein
MTACLILLKMNNVCMPISKLIIEKKEREIRRLQKLTPEERLREQVEHNAMIKKIFFAGLSSKGFSRAEIVRLWIQKQPL